jgi:hypothetical protein
MKTTNLALENATKVQVAADSATGFAGVADYVVDGAPFTCQAPALAEITTVKDYMEWCVGLASACPSPTYDVHAKAWDPDTSTVLFSCTYHVQHTAKGTAGPPEPTNMAADSDYVYTFSMNGKGKVTAMKKVWNDLEALKKLGWA